MSEQLPIHKGVLDRLPLYLLALLGDRDQIREDFTNEGRGHSPKHLKFFLLVFSKIKEELK